MTTTQYTRAVFQVRAPPQTSTFLLDKTRGDWYLYKDQRDFGSGWGPTRERPAVPAHTQKPTPLLLGWLTISLSFGFFYGGSCVVRSCECATSRRVTRRKLKKTNSHMQRLAIKPTYRQQQLATKTCENCQQFGGDGSRVQSGPNVSNRSLKLPYLHTGPKVVRVTLDASMKKLTQRQRSHSPTDPRFHVPQPCDTVERRQ